MKITSLEVYKVKPRWLFVKVNTDEGISGWGELISGTRTETVATGVLEVGDHIIGKNPCNIEDIWQELYRFFFRGGPVDMTIVSGIEMALWDIKGKYYNIPVYEFLGGSARDKIMVYSWIGGDRPDDVAKEALIRKERGFKAVKMNATEELHYIDSFKKIDAVLERVASIRESAGKDLEIGVDFHGRVHKAMAKVLAKELEPFRPMFIEEPVLPENNEALREIAAHTSIPIATGERFYTRWGFKDIFRSGIVDIVQPDLALTGGILEAKKIAAMAEAYDVAVAPHAPYGPVALAATLQFDVCTPNVFIQEQSLGIHYNRGFDLLDFVKNKEIFQYEDGFVNIPKGPGLGLEIDEEKVQKISLEGLHWRNPKWRNYDGTIAEW
ncbi:galactonate dehydratase [Bacillota bacterium Lsc_1132]